MSVSLKLRCSLAVAALVAFAPAAIAQQQPATPADAQVSQPDDQMSDTPVSSHITVIGAVRDRNAPTQTVAEDESVPELPVVYEDDATASPADAAPPASPAS